MTYAPPVSEGGRVAWWNVFTIGNRTRATQIAYYGFDPGKTNIVFIRRQHDAGVSDWVQLSTSKDIDNLQNQINTINQKVATFP